MAATSMPSLNLLLHRLQADYPAIIFRQGVPCRWSPSESTVYYDLADTAENKAVLLHEVAHALLGHDTYNRDIELLSKEREAWQYASSDLSKQYDVTIDPDLVEAHLETYRDWLHERSLCPTCHQTGIQTKTKTYSCINCRSLWRVNDARQCQQRRWKFAA